MLFGTAIWSCHLQKVFTKMAKVPVSIVRSEGHMAMMYIDDGFIIGLMLQLCWQAVQCFLNIFLWFLPHPENCSLWPSQQVQVIEFIIDSVSMTTTTTPNKMIKIHNLESACQK